MSCPEYDADEQRRADAARWDEAASGWERQQSWMRGFGAPVSQWLVAAINPRPGQRVLELAAGLGETGFLAAALVGPDGQVISSDQSQSMIDAGRRRAAELGLTNVEFKLLGGEWIDLPVASVDAVLCRFGYMLMTDPSAALGETRRVLRSGGRLALAVWAGPHENPWVAIAAQLLIERELMQPPAPGGPGMFALSDPGRLTEMLEEAGFTEVQIDTVDVVAAYDSLDAYWEQSLDCNRGFHDAVMSLAPEQADELRVELGQRLAAFMADGALAVPGRVLVAAADA